MDINDFFGKNQHRPEHPDFWRLSSIALKYDGRMQAATTRAQQDATWEDNVARWVDSDSLNYLAMQRSMRVLGMETVGDIRKNADALVRCTVLYMEGFQFGAEFATEPVKGEALDDLDETGLRILLSAYEIHAREKAQAGEEPLSVVEFYDDTLRPKDE